jgi:hypothetical protein
MQNQCAAIEDKGYYWGMELIDPNEPQFEKGKGVWIPQPRRCTFVSEPSGKLCGKHAFILAQLLEDSSAVEDKKA